MTAEASNRHSVAVLQSSFVLESDEVWQDRILTIFAALPPCDVGEHHLVIEGEDQDSRLILDGVTLLDGVRSWAIIDRIVWEANQIAWRSAPDHVLVHAAVVEIEGQGVLIYGPSGVGKSTLAAALCVAGAGYLSDEIAVLDPKTGSVLPYAKPLTIRSQMWDAFAVVAPPKWLAEHMRAVWYVPLRPAAAVPISVVVAPDFQATGDVYPVVRSRAEVLIELCSQTPQLKRYGVGGFEALADIVRDAECVTIDTTDLAIACRKIFDLVASTGHNKNDGA